MNRLKRSVRIDCLDQQAELPNIAKITRKRILVGMALVKSMIKGSSMTPRHKRLCMEKSKKYMKTDMKFVLFIAER